MQKNLDNQNSIEVRSVSKAIKDGQILSNITFSVGKGECFGILGENGSGKTMLLRMITGLVSPTSGLITVDGYDPNTQPEKALSSMGALIGVPAFYDNMTSFNNIKLMADTNKAPSNEEVMAALEEVGLEAEHDKKVGAFSRGMLQRLGIALALLANRNYIVLDEPTQGVDDIWVDRLVDIFKARNTAGTTFIMTSHNFDFIMELCSKIMIIDNCRVAYNGLLKEIAEFPYYFHLNCSPASKGVEVMNRLDYVHRIIKSNGALEVTIKKDNVSELIKTLIDEGCTVSECALKHYSVSDLVSQRGMEQVEK